MPRVGYEPKIPVFERMRTVHAYDRAATVIGLILPSSLNFITCFFQRSLVVRPQVFTQLYLFVVQFFKYQFLFKKHCVNLNLNLLQCPFLYSAFLI
jgi:hypothetical protein